MPSSGFNLSQNCYVCAESDVMVLKGGGVSTCINGDAFYSQSAEYF